MATALTQRECIHFSRRCIQAQRLEELHSGLDLIKYYDRFIPNLVAVLYPFIIYYISMNASPGPSNVKMPLKRQSRS